MSARVSSKAPLDRTGSEGNLFGLDDQLTVMRGNAEQRLDVTDRAEQYATELVASWLESDPRGAELIAEAIEAEREHADELRELTERAA